MAKFDGSKHTCGSPAVAAIKAEMKSLKAKVAKNEQDIAGGKSGGKATS